MDETPKGDYEAPRVEQVETEDAPAVTAAGNQTIPTDASDLALKRAIRPLDGQTDSLR